MELIWEEIYENQRKTLNGWKNTPQTIVDPPHFSTKEFRQMPDPPSLQLPKCVSDYDNADNNSDDNESKKYDWIWADKWKCSEWVYAPSFGATLNLKFKWSFTQKSGWLSARQRVWRRPRIRRINSDEYYNHSDDVINAQNLNNLNTDSLLAATDYVIENERHKVLSAGFVAPYWPGDRPNFSDSNGKLKTKKDVERMLPPNWEWVTQWKIEKGDHCDLNGWEYSVDFLFAQTEPKRNVFVHNVRQRKWIRVRRKMQQFETKPQHKKHVQRKKKYRESKLSIFGGWGDTTPERDEVKVNFGDADNEDLPFRISICWNYERVLTTKRSRKYGALSVWRPLINQQKNKNRNKGKFNLQNNVAKFANMIEREYFLGYLGLHLKNGDNINDIDPNGGIPSLIVKCSEQGSALKPPTNFGLLHMDYITRKDNKTNENINVFRYWLELIAPSGYAALGSVVIEQVGIPILDKIINGTNGEFKRYLLKEKQYQRYGLESLVCIKKEYLQQGAYFTDIMAQVIRQPQPFTVYHQPSLCISGVYSLVEMPMMLRKYNNNTANNNNNNHNNNIKERETLQIDYKILDNCAKEYGESIRVTKRAPLLISYAQHYKFVWSNKKLKNDGRRSSMGSITRMGSLSSDIDNEKCGIWEPVLGDGEYMVGHIAFSDYQHPCSKPNNNRLIIVKDGGNDPDAFKKPSDFKCVWFEQIQGDTFQRTGRRSIDITASGGGSGVKKVGSFWKPIPPPGYVALGDIALLIDGEKLEDLINDESKTNNLQRILPYGVSRFVCVKEEYVAMLSERERERERERRQSHNNNRRNDNNKNAVKKKNNSENKPNINIRRNSAGGNFIDVWSSLQDSKLKYHSVILRQPPVKGDIISPMFCIQAGSNPITKFKGTNSMYQSLKKNQIFEVMCNVRVLKAGYLQKISTTFGLVPQYSKRFCILTNERKFYYYKKDELKSVIKLDRLTDIIKSKSNQQWLHVRPDSETKLDFEANSNKDASEWVQCLQIASDDSKPISFVIQMDATDGKDGADTNATIPTDEKEEKNNYNAYKYNFSNVKSLAKSPRDSLLAKHTPQEDWINMFISDTMDKYRSLVKEKQDQINSTNGEVIHGDESMKQMAQWYQNIEKTYMILDILLTNWDNVNNYNDNNINHNNYNRYSSISIISNGSNISNIGGLGLSLSRVSTNGSNTSSASGWGYGSRSRSLWEYDAAAEKRLTCSECTKSVKKLVLRDIDVYTRSDEILHNDALGIRLYQACLLMEGFPTGKQDMCEWISNLVLKDIKNTNIVYDKQFEKLDRRFSQFRRAMELFDSRYEIFVPQWWDLGVQISCEFCNILKQELNKHLARNPIKNRAIALNAIQQCTQFENKVIEDALNRVNAVVIHVRSWTLNDNGDPCSWIKINNKNYKPNGRGISMVELELKLMINSPKKHDLRWKVLRQIHFDFNCDPKSKTAFSNRLKEFDTALQTVGTSSLIILCGHSSIGNRRMTISKTMKEFGLSQTDLPDKTQSFIFIGSKSKDFNKNRKSFIICPKTQDGKGPYHYRRIIKPTDLVDLPSHHDDIQIIEVKRMDEKKHHDDDGGEDGDDGSTHSGNDTTVSLFRGVLSEIFKKYLLLPRSIKVRNQANTIDETFDDLYQSRWLHNNMRQIVQNGKFDRFHCHLPSVIKIDNAMCEGIQLCKDSSSDSEGVLKLVTEYCKILQEYAQNLCKLVKDTVAGESAVVLNTILQNFVRKLIRTPGQTPHSNDVYMNNDQMKEFFSWQLKDKAELFIIYCSVIVNTSRKVRYYLFEKLDSFLAETENQHLKGRVGFEEIEQFFKDLENQVLTILCNIVLIRINPAIFFTINPVSNNKNVSYFNLIKGELTFFFRYPRIMISEDKYSWFLNLFVTQFCVKLFKSMIFDNRFNSNSVMIQQMLRSIKHNNNKKKDDGHNINCFYTLMQDCIVTQLPPNHRQSCKTRIKRHIGQCVQLIDAIISLYHANVGHSKKPVSVPKQAPRPAPPQQRPPQRPPPRMHMPHRDKGKAKFDLLRPLNNIFNGNSKNSKSKNVNNSSRKPDIVATTGNINANNSTKNNVNVANEPTAQELEKQIEGSEFGKIAAEFLNEFDMLNQLKISLKHDSKQENSDNDEKEESIDDKNIRADNIFAYYSLKWRIIERIMQIKQLSQNYHNIMQLWCTQSVVQPQ